MNLAATTQTITEVEKANYEFDVTMADQNAFRYQLFDQVSEIEHLMRLLNFELAQQKATKGKVEFVALKEQEMQQQKDARE